MKHDLAMIFRALALLAGIGCLVLFWSAENVWQEIAWATYATALFALSVALKE